MARLVCPFEPQQSHLWAGKEPEGHEARAEPARDVQLSRSRLMEPLPVQRPKVFEPQFSSRRRDADLPSVQVAGEGQVEVPRLEPPDDVRKMAQQDPEVGLRIH